MTKKYLSKLSIVFIFLVPFIVCFSVASTTGFKDLFAAVIAIREGWILAACFLIGLYWILEAFVLRSVCFAFGSRQSFKTVLKTTMIGQLFNCITPFASGGQPIQMLHLVKSGKLSSGTAGSVLIIKFIIYQTILSIYSMVVLLFRFQYFAAKVPYLTALALLGFTVNFIVVIMLVSLARNKTFALKMINGISIVLYKLKLVKNLEAAKANNLNEIEKFHQGYAILKSDKKIWIDAGALTILQLTSYYLIACCLYKAFGLSGNVFNILTAHALVQMITAFIPLPGAAGAAEGIFYMFFKLFFTENHLGAALLLWRFITYYSCIIVGYLFMMYPSIKKLLYHFFKPRIKPPAF